MKVEHEFSSNSLQFGFVFDVKDIREGFMKNNKISKLFRQIILNPKFNSMLEDLWKLTETEYSFNEYKEMVINQIAMEIFDAGMTICRKDFLEAIDDAICFCIYNNIKSDGSHFVKISAVDARLLLENKEIDEAFSKILQDKEIIQCIDDIGRLSYHSDLRYMFLDGILCYAYYTACCLVVNDLTLSLEQAICNALTRESILGWLKEYKEYFAK